MGSPDSLFVTDGRVVAVVGGKGPIPLGNLSARIVVALGRKNGGLTGSQLARELGVTPTAISKAAETLLDLGIVRKEPLPVAKNVKLYFLAMTVIDDVAVKELRKRIPPVLLKLIQDRFRGNEALATVFLGQLLDYVRSLPESDMILQQLLKDMMGAEDVDPAKS